jgi:hypothetical protein
VRRRRVVAAAAAIVAALLLLLFLLLPLLRLLCAQTIRVLQDKAAHPSSGPWFHAVGLKRPHLSYRAPSEFFAMYVPALACSSMRVCLWALELVRVVVVGLLVLALLVLALAHMRVCAATFVCVCACV